MARPARETCHPRHELEVTNMTWRPTKYLVEGELDNTEPGIVTGWMQFAGMKERVTLDLKGDFCSDIRGARILLSGTYSGSRTEAADEMDGFGTCQTGKVGKITAGLPPQEYTPYPFIEWEAEANGRVVMYLESEQVRLVGNDGAATDRDSCPQHPRQIESRGRPTRIRLLTKELRRRLPPLYAQEAKGRDAVVYVKFFTPDSSWTWYATEFDGEDLFFGLACGFEKELGYFSLSELESARGPMGLPIERDLYWEPKTLAEIAPELFAKSEAERSAG